MNMAFNFGEPVRFLAIHPAYGQVIVEAYCGLEAKLAAAIAWDAPFEQIEKECKLGVDKAELRRVQNESGRDA